MKQVALLILVILLALSVSSSRAQPSAPLTVYGDSITAGLGASAPAHAYAAIVADALGVPLDNRAIGGSTLAEQLAAYAPPSGERVLVLAGYNDMRAGTPLAEFRATLEQLLARLPGAYVAGVLPMTAAGYAAYGPRWNHGSAEAVAAYTAAIREVAGARYVSLAGYDARNVDADLVHPNDAGHAQIAASVLAVLAPPPSFPAFGWTVAHPTSGAGVVVYQGPGWLVKQRGVDERIVDTALDAGARTYHTPTIAPIDGFWRPLPYDRYCVRRFGDEQLLGCTTVPLPTMDRVRLPMILKG